MKFIKNNTKLDEGAIDENMKSKMKIFYEENKDKITVTEEDAKLRAKGGVYAVIHTSDYSAIIGNKPVLRVHKDSEGKLRLGYMVLVKGNYDSDGDVAFKHI